MYDRIPLYYLNTNYHIQEYWALTYIQNVIFSAKIIPDIQKLI